MVFVRSIAGGLACVVVSFLGVGACENPDRDFGSRGNARSSGDGGRAGAFGGRGGASGELGAVGWRTLGAPTRERVALQDKRAAMALRVGARPGRSNAMVCSL